ncbi:MAG: diphthine--ammonia ligase [Balneolaceae bacterium]|nr:diphthine--ammonia ligase [Balneolaceae bacterium]MDR9408716.1 diphthine--ammonia ligase [Balneolaceae bacterium]
MSSSKYKTILSWSGGKDSAITLQRLLKDNQYSVERLLVSVNESTKRVSMHGVRVELIERQAEILGIPITYLKLPASPSMDEYNSLMEKQMHNLMEEGFTHCAFGDIFLEDLKKYREKNLEKVGMNALFPIWGEDTDKLAHSFIDDGFKAIFACVDKNKAVSDYVGETFSKEFLDEMTAEIDPCGENGEFHTFVFDGPIFSESIPHQKGKIEDKEYPSPKGEGKMVFRFCDLVLG